jgi:hypothetical protein
MNKFLNALLLVLCISLILAVPVLAQETTPSLDNHLSILEIDIRPEFDQPDVLVIYHMVLSPDEKLPASVTVRIPTRAEKPSAVQAVDSTDGSMMSLPFTSTTSENWILVTFTTATAEVNFEYHDPLLTKNAEARDYQFIWPGDYQIDNLSLYIQQPVDATNMTISPNLGNSKVGENGITYFYSQLGGLSLGTAFSVGIQYDKSSDALSASQLQVEPSGRLDDSTPGRVTIMELVPWIAGFALLVAILGAIWWYWVLRHAPERKRKVSRHQASGTRKASHSDGNTYCHECGQRAEKGDLFCRVCGTKLRLG